MPPRPRRGQRLVLYLSLTLLVPLFVGLAVLLGASAPARTPLQSPVAEARIPSPDSPQALREPEPLLTLKAEDVPLLKSLRERQTQLDERDKQLANRDKQLTNREADLRLVQQQIEEKLTALALLRKEMGDLLQEKAAFEEKRFEHLVKVYEVMKPEEVSSLFETAQRGHCSTLALSDEGEKSGTDSRLHLASGRGKAERAPGQASATGDPAYSGKGETMIIPGNASLAIVSPPQEPQGTREEEGGFGALLTEIEHHATSLSDQEEQSSRALESVLQALMSLFQSCHTSQSLTGGLRAGDRRAGLMGVRPAGGLPLGCLPGMVSDGSQEHWGHSLSLRRIVGDRALLH